MRKIVGILLIAIMVLPLLSGCGVAQEEHDAVVDERDEAQGQVASLQGDLAEAQSQLETIESDLAAARSQVQTLQHDYDRIKNEVLERIEESGLRNPTWEELREFLLLEETDKLHYDKDSFDCTGFTITVRDHAQEYGFRCAFVEVSFTAGEGHAFNAFETTDKGLIYVDDTGTASGLMSFDCEAFIDANGKVRLQPLFPEDKSRIAAITYVGGDVYYEGTLWDGEWK